MTPTWPPIFSMLAAAGPGGGAGAEPASVDPAAVVSSPLEPVLFAGATVGVLALSLGIAVCLVRMFKGPHLADRVLASDTLALQVVGLVVVLALRYETAMFFDAALVVSVLGFASTVAFSQYIFARRGKPDDVDEPPAAEPRGPAQEASP